jgi:hypothetical protein
MCGRMIVIRDAACVFCAKSDPPNDDERAASGRGVPRARTFEAVLSARVGLAQACGSGAASRNENEEARTTNVDQ